MLLGSIDNIFWHFKVIYAIKIVYKTVEDSDMQIYVAGITDIFRQHCDKHY